MQTRTQQMRERCTAAFASALLLAGSIAWGQERVAPPQPVDVSDVVDEVVMLSPFEVSAEAATGYAAANTLAGNRLNTELRDVGSAVSVITSEFLKDTGAVNNETLLQYTTATEVGNVYGNFSGVGVGATMDESTKFANPNQNTRVRGLATADNTRDFFLTDIPWDGYNVDRVDMQRGPNAILFGLGSPAGIINTGLKGAAFKDANELEFRYGSFGSTRSTINLNRELLDDELAVRVAALYDDERFKQEPAYERDERLFGAIRYEPGFMKQGSARTVLKANYEVGEVRSNRPRQMPPIDLITPWFYTGTFQGRDSRGNPMAFNNINKQTFDPFLVQDDVSQAPNRGQNRPTYNVGGAANPYYSPWLGNFAQNYGGPLAVFEGNNATPARYFLPEIRTVRGINSSGNIDGGIGGFPYHRQVGVADFYLMARNANLPFAALYKNRSLTDASVFDFYNSLLDGPNKREWGNFDALNVNVVQTFFHDKMGIEAVYDQQNYDNGTLALLSDQRQAIYIDMMATLSDGSANPNVGRPFISDGVQYGNGSFRSERDSTRITAFLTHDFQTGGQRNWLTRVLGRHVLTGLYSRDVQFTDTRSWQRYGLDDGYKQFINNQVATKTTDNLMQLNPVIYVGPSLLNATSASGAGIERPGAVQVLPSGSVWAFDSTWNAPASVSPGAFWDNPFYPEGNGNRNSTQSENPANYVGWRQVPVTVRDSEQGYRDALTYSGRLAKQRIASKAVVLQSHFWDNVLVGTVGVRKDTAKGWSYQAAQDALGLVSVGENYRLPAAPGSTISDTTTSWSVVAHLTNLFPDRFPVRVSAFYNESSNFRPAANRVDLYGRPLSAPTGETTDQGLLFSTPDDRFSLKINKYRTAVMNETSSQVANSWFLGALEAWGANWANVFEHNLGGFTMDTANTGNSGRYNYGPATGESAEQAAAREAAAVAAWRAHQARVPRAFYEAWGLSQIPAGAVINFSAQGPSGFTPTEDAVSKGWEIEFNANITRNWRMSINAAKTEAVRTNVGGEALAEFIGIVEEDLRNTAAGDLRIWWGGAGNTTTALEWARNVGASWQEKKLQEGTSAPELREWRFNLITNYDVKEGRLKGMNIGAGYRWQDDIILGYTPVQGAGANDVTFDLSRPFRGPSEDNIDLWIGYSRKLRDKIDWQIQLNVRNAFEDDGLIPITTQPDGTPAHYRIAPPQTWTLTNTFRF